MQMCKWDDGKMCRFTVDETIFWPRIRCLNFTAKVMQTYHRIQQGRELPGESGYSRIQCGQEWKRGDGYGGGLLIQACRHKGDGEAAKPRQRQQAIGFRTYLQDESEDFVMTGLGIGESGQHHYHGLSLPNKEGFESDLWIPSAGLLLKQIFLKCSDLKWRNLIS